MLSKFVQPISKALPKPHCRALTPFSTKAKDHVWAKPTAEDECTHPAQDVFEAGLRHHHTANTAYPIAHSKTLRPYRVARSRDQEQLSDAVYSAYGHLEEIMLYVHVPFCEQRCQFCEYTVVDPVVGTRSDVQDMYFDALMGEFDLYREILATDSKKLVGFDIGGGTPSLASIANLERVMRKMNDCFDFVPSSMAISIETTPRIAASEPDKIKAYYDMGIRRISMGVQTTDFALAKRLGRNDSDYLAQAVNNIRWAGFQSFNIDLMYGFPLREDGKDKWIETISSTIHLLEPDHITLYRMRYKGTKMAHLQERVGLEQVNRQAAKAVEILTDAGYHGWVGKNTFSRLPGNSGCSDYLEKRVVHGVPYLGLGLGAQSFSHSTLAYNLGSVTKQLQQYSKSIELGRLPIQDLYHLSRSGAWAKFCSVSFYFGGIDLASFEANFGLTLKEAFPDKVAFVVEKGLMQYQGRRLQMTPLGKSQYGGVLALFYAPHVQQHLMDLPGGEANATLYMGEDRLVPTNCNSVDEQASISNNRRPYVGNPLPRYERRRMKRQDPRGTLPADWAESAQGSETMGRRKFFSTSTRVGETQPRKQYRKNQYEFGNILFGGPCNQRCVFCIGQQLPSQMSPRNHRTWPPRNLDIFIEKMKASGTQRVILTGTTTDPQLYQHESVLLEYLRAQIPNVHLSVHTNGLLVLRKLKTFNQYDSATISLNSFVPETFAKIHGVSTMPDIKTIVKKTLPPIKLSCVLTPENIDEVESYLKSAIDSGVKRVALRNIIDVRHGINNPATPVILPMPIMVLQNLEPTRYHCGNPVFVVDGVEVTYWQFDKTSGKSLNLFANGFISEEYLLSNAPNTNKTH